MVRSSPQSEHASGLLVELWDILLQFAEDEIAAVPRPLGMLHGFHIVHVSIATDDNAAVAC